MAPRTRASLSPVQLTLTAIDDQLSFAWQRFCGDLPFVKVHRGSILDVPCDAIVSPANSFGFMDGGIDALYRRHFGPTIQERVQATIHDRHHGELLVGVADIIETSHTQIPYMIVAPTMRVPMILTESVNAYLAARAILLLVQHGRFANGQPIRDTVHTIAFPGLGTGVGQLSPNICAHQVRSAIDEVILQQTTPPHTWVEASERHQLLYTDRPRRLQ